MCPWLLGLLLCSTDLRCLHSALLADVTWRLWNSFQILSSRHCLGPAPGGSGKPRRPPCLGAGHPARGPSPLLSAETRPLSPSAPASCPSCPSPQPHCWCFQPSGALCNSPFLRLQKMHFATYFFSLLLLGDSWEAKRGMLAFPAPWDPGWLWTSSRPWPVGTALLFLPPPRPELRPSCYIPFNVQELHTSALRAGFGAVSSICIVLSLVTLLQQEGEEKPRPVPTNHAGVFMCV